MTTTEKQSGYDVIRGLMANDVHPDHARAIGSAIVDVQTTERQLIELSHQLERKAADVRDSLAKGYNLNRLGELQSMGPRFDQLVAQRQAQVETVMVLVHLLANETDAKYVRGVLSQGVVA